MSGGAVKRKLDEVGGEGREARRERDTYEETFYEWAYDIIQTTGSAVAHSDSLPGGVMGAPWESVEKLIDKSVPDDYLDELEQEQGCEFPLEGKAYIRIVILAHVREYVLMVGVSNAAYKMCADRMPHLQTSLHARTALRTKNHAMLRAAAAEVAMDMRTRCSMLDAAEHSEDEEEEEEEEEVEDEPDDDDLDEVSDEEEDEEGEDDAGEEGEGEGEDEEAP